MRIAPALNAVGRRLGLVKASCLAFSS